MSSYFIMIKKIILSYSTVLIWDLIKILASYKTMNEVIMMTIPYEHICPDRYVEVFGESRPNSSANENKY